MIWLLGLHLLVLPALPGLAARLGPRVFAVAALPPAVAFCWLAASAGPVVAGRARSASLPWVPALDLEVALRLDALALLAGLLVTGIGAVTLLYCVRYFAGSPEGAGRTAAVLTLFAGSMLALVLADNLIALYVAWELTTVCSFLLIGGAGRAAEPRAAAARALLVTTGGGLVMLIGFLLLGRAAGTFTVSALVADPPTGATASSAVVLVLVGAFTKSAQVPFQAWLPAAMVAPTPVSAYLHAAAMVKAGVYLIARLAPGFAGLPPWRPLVLTVGVASLLYGGWRALTQTDLKRLLAFSTIAQLGLLTALLGMGTRTAALAGATMFAAHALYKSALFLATGTVEHQSGGRDLRELSGLGRRAPLLAGLCGLACASMAGLPPLVGYIGKEATFAAFTGPSPADVAVLAGVVAGSALTAGYALRYLWAAFGRRPGVATGWSRPGPGLLLPVALLAAAGLAAGVFIGATSALAGGYAGAFPVRGEPYELKLWHGIGGPLIWSVLTLLAGALIHRWLVRRRRASPGGADRFPAVEDVAGTSVLAAARWITARTQVGSLPAYLGVIALTAVAVPGVVFATRVGLPGDIRAYDRPGQLPFAVAVVVCCAAIAAARRRLTSVLALAAVGYLVAGLFVTYGAPDLALVQILVETLTLFVIILVLRRMPRGPARPPAPLRPLRVALAVAGGLFATATTLAVGARHAPSRVAPGYLAGSAEQGGDNVVNVVITGFRALDTLGEMTVLALAATGVASLILVSTRRGRVPEQALADLAESPPIVQAPEELA